MLNTVRIRIWAKFDNCLAVVVEISVQCDLRTGQSARELKHCTVICTINVQKYCMLKKLMT